MDPGESERRRNVLRHPLNALGLELGTGQGRQEQRGQDGNNRDDD